MIDDWREIERHAARYIWRKRDEITPSGEWTWGEWYERKFGRSLDAAAADFTAEARRNERSTRAAGAANGRGTAAGGEHS